MAEAPVALPSVDPGGDSGSPDRWRGSRGFWTSGRGQHQGVDREQAMESYPVDIDPAQVVRWVKAEQEGAQVVRWVKAE
jgi:hypothetical protein